MFEDLRKSAKENLENEDEEVNEEFDSYDTDDQDEEQTKKLFLGMSSFQRFILAGMLFVITCIFAVFVLVLTGRIYLPFF